MTQGLQFSLLFSGLDALTTGDTAVLKSDMADSAAAQQAVAFRQILQDEQYSKTVRQGQTLAAASAQQQANGQGIGATEQKAAQVNFSQDVGTAVGQESTPEDSDLEDSGLAEQWLGLIRQSSDTSAQLKQKSDMATQFVNVQFGSEIDRIGPVPDEDAEWSLDSIVPDLKNVQLVDEGQQKTTLANNEFALLQKSDVLQAGLLNQESLLSNVKGKVGADNLTTQLEGSIAELDADGEHSPRASNNAAAETDELAPQQNAKQNVSKIASTASETLPATTVLDTDSKPLEASMSENTLPDTELLVSGTATKTATLPVDLSVVSQSKDKQNDSKSQDRSTLSSSQTKVAQNHLSSGERNTANTLQDAVSNLDGEAVYLNEMTSIAEPKLTTQVLAETATTVKLDTSIGTGTDNSTTAKSETTAQVIAAISQPTAQAMLANAAAEDVKAASATAEMSATLTAATTTTPVLPEVDEVNAVIADSERFSETVAGVTNKDNQQTRQNGTMSLNHQAELVSRAESDIAVTSNLAETHVKVNGMASGKDKSSANLTEAGMVNTNKISASKADKGADTADSQSEQQGQSRQDGRQFTFNRLEVALAQNTAQPAASVATNSSVQVSDTAGVIARAESFATVLEQQNRPQSTVAAPSLAAQLKQLNLQQQDAAGQLRERVQLMVRQNVQVAEIRLDPAELGQMQIRVNLQQEQASVQFIVQQQHAKELLEQQMPRLRELLQQQGIQLGEGQVQQQTREERQQAEQRSAGGSQHNDDKQAGTDSASQTTTVELSQSERLVDYYA